jgi:hypothetical protein
MKGIQVCTNCCENTVEWIAWGYYVFCDPSCLVAWVLKNPEVAKQIQEDMMESEKEG